MNWFRRPPEVYSEVTKQLYTRVESPSIFCTVFVRYKGRHCTESRLPVLPLSLFLTKEILNSSQYHFTKSEISTNRKKKKNDKLPEFWSIYVTFYTKFQHNNFT